MGPSSGISFPVEPASPPSYDDGMKKYVAVAAAVVMQACLGGIYAWSAFVPALSRQFGYSASQTQIIFGSTIGVLSVVMLFSGRLQDRIGPRPLGILAGLFTMVQYLAAGFFGDRFASLWGAISGCGGLAVGCGYVSAMATGVKWFPHRKGLVSGLVVAGYGGGAILLTTLGQLLFARGWTVLEIFRLVGLVYGPIVVLAGSLLFIPAPAHADAHETYSFGRLLADRRYWTLAIGIFCCTFPGLALIGLLKSIGLAASVPEAVAAAAIGVLAAGNASGRLSWGAIQDHVGPRATTLTCLSLSSVSAGLFLLTSGHPSLFLALSAFLGFCYGGGLSLFAAQAAHEFGVRQFGATYPLVVLAHGLAAIIAPPIMGWTRDRTGSFNTGILMAVAVSVAGVIAYGWLTRPPRGRILAAGKTSEAAARWHSTGETL